MTLLLAASPIFSMRRISTALAADPEAVKVREWRHRLQKTFLTDGKDPKPEVRC